MTKKEAWVSGGLSVSIFNIGMVLVYLGQGTMHRGLDLGIGIELTLILYFCYGLWFKDQSLLGDLKIKSFEFMPEEQWHEQKRHIQIALALVELGEKEQAAQYLSAALNEIS